jgi:hypothetical protein
MKMRGEAQFPEAGVVKEFPTYSVYTGTQPHPEVTGLWRRKSADTVLAHALTTQGRESRYRRRAEHEEGQQQDRDAIQAMRDRTAARQRARMQRKGKL